MQPDDLGLLLHHGRGRLAPVPVKEATEQGVGVGTPGEAKAVLGPGGKLLLNPLIATQNFEYKFGTRASAPLNDC